MSQGEQSRSYSPWPHRVAWVLCCATFPLIWVGGLVTTYDAGMAVPDWPTTYGYNLFLYPWQTWVFGPFDLFIEHGHRLLGALVGLLAIAFALVSARADRHRHGVPGENRLLPYSLVAFGLVLTQGVLGGMRVQLDARGLAMLHGCFGLATFGYLCAMTVLTSRSWNDSPNRVSSGPGSRCPRFALWTTGLIYLQIIFGAFLRHVPVGAPHQYFRLAVLFHLLIAVGVAAHVFLWARAISREAAGKRELVRPLIWLGALVCCQILLGLGTWVLKYGWPASLADQPLLAGYTIEANSLWQAMVTTAHVATGALILGSSVVGSLRTWRFFRPAITASSSVACMGWTT